MESIKYEIICSELWKRLPKDQIDIVMHQYECDIEPCFLGFVDIYKRLSEIIPKHFTVIDLGCAFNPQCFYFENHKQYVAVDASQCQKFKTDNCIFYTKTIGDFLKENIKDYDLDETFAICSYVPMWHGDKDIKIGEYFKNLFVYYPHGGYKQPKFELTQKELK